MEAELKRKRYMNQSSLYNNKSLLMFAVFLFIEQLLYGLIFTGAGTLIGRTHLITSMVSGVYAIILGAIYSQNRQSMKPAFWKDTLQFSYLVFCLSVAVYRGIYISSTDFSVPVIYIAVLYGSAFLFYYPPAWSFVLYGSTMTAFIFLSININGGVPYPTFVQDIFFNNVLAWIGSMVSYQRFVRQMDSAIMIEEQNRELIKLSSTDALTNLYNRRHIDKSLEEVHTEAENSGTTYSVILADIDYFKKINDDYGHTTGDKILVEATAIFKDIVGERHLLGRWGGEEFMILCKNLDLATAYKLAEIMREAMEKNCFSVEKKITCSFGVSVYTEGMAAHEVVRNADEALYNSKEKGRNLVTVCSII